MMRLLEGIYGFPILRNPHEIILRIGKGARWRKWKRSIDTLVANQLIAQRSWSCVGVRLDLRFVLGFGCPSRLPSIIVSQSCPVSTKSTYRDLVSVSAYDW